MVFFNEVCHSCNVSVFNNIIIGNCGICWMLACWKLLYWIINNSYKASHHYGLKADTSRVIAIHQSKAIISFAGQVAHLVQRARTWIVMKANFNIHEFLIIQILVTTSAPTKQHSLLLIKANSFLIGNCLLFL